MEPTSPILSAGRPLTTEPPEKPLRHDSNVETPKLWKPTSKDVFLIWYFMLQIYIFFS